MGAARYSTRFTRLVYSVTQDSATGAPVDTYTPQTQKLWGELLIDSGRRDQEFGAVQTGMFATATLSQYPPLDPRDRLQDDTGVVWVIENKRYYNNETVCSLQSLDAGQPS